jgi:NitT/TauT family transport system permease protein
MGSAAKRRVAWLKIGKPIPKPRVWLLGIAVWAIFFAVWQGAVLLDAVNPLLVPGPGKVLAKLVDLFVSGGFVSDIADSVWRVAVSFAGACLIAVPLGILMGAFRTAEAFFNPFVSAWRYLPAPSFIPILLMWFGTGEAPKLALLFVGVVFFLITLIMDHTRQVRTELVETAQTLGASEWQVLRTVIVPAVMPNVLVSMRQMLAVAWTYLVIAEIVASTTGIGAMMMRARRFLHTDEIMAGIITIGVLGLLCDLLFRLVHRLMFPYLEARSS